VRRPLIAVVLAGTLLAGGCGIPDSSEVRPLRQGPVGSEVNPAVAPPDRPFREDTTNVKDFVTNFLTVAAGDPATAADRFKKFLSPRAATTFKQTDAIKVIHVVGEPLINPDNPEVTVKYRDVGQLKQNGQLEASTNGVEQVLALDIGDVNGESGLWVRTSPQSMLLSDTALDKFYQRQTIYFWNQEGTGLVPDLRYLPRDLPETQRPTEIIDWLTDGPQSWLGGVTKALPDGTRRIGVVPVTNQTLQLSLTAQALPQEDRAGALQRLQQQLRWSLRPMPAATLELSVDHEAHTYSDDDYLPANPAYQPTETERFAIYKGQIVRLARSARSGDPVPIIRPQDNRSIASAALAVSGNRSYAALVVNESNGRKALKVGATGTGDLATLSRASLSGTVGQPVWARSPNGTDENTHGLITIGGKLYGFPATGFTSKRRLPTPIQWSNSPPPGAITAVAVAPDAHRVALIAGGTLYLSGLSLGDGGLELGPTTPLRTELRQLTAVTWSTETSLTLAGLRRDSDRYALMDVLVDGSRQTNRQDLGSNPVTSLTSRPANPVRSAESNGTVAYTISNSGFDEQKATPLTPDDVAEKDPKPGDARPTAPFFLG
jgi:hypothetical protein